MALNIRDLVIQEGNFQARFDSLDAAKKYLQDRIGRDIIFRYGINNTLATQSELEQFGLGEFVKTFNVPSNAQITAIEGPGPIPIEDTAAKQAALNASARETLGTPIPSHEGFDPSKLTPLSYYTTLKQAQDPTFDPSKLTTLAQQTPSKTLGAGQPTLVSFTSGPSQFMVWDVSGDAMRHVTAEEFANKGFNQSQVQKVSPDSVRLERDQDDFRVFANILGNKVWVQNIQDFTNADFKWDKVNIITPQQKLEQIDTKDIESNVPDMFEEVRSRRQLGLIWDAKEHLQAIYDRPDQYSAGASADPSTEGTTMETWAMLQGWQEEPELLAAYRPANVVRSAYWNLFQRDPFDPKTLDPMSVPWINALKSGEITSFGSLRAKMQMDTGKEWDKLNEQDKTDAEVDFNLPIEDITDLKLPTYFEFLQKRLDREAVDKQVEDFYTNEFKNFINEKETTERRTIKDWSELVVGDITEDEIEDLRTGRTDIQSLQDKLIKEGRKVGGVLSEEEDRNLTTVQKQFRQALNESAQGFGSRGLAFSSLRIEEENKLRQELKGKRENIIEDIERRRKEAEKEKQRMLQDIETAKRLETEKIAREKPLKKEEEIQSREAEELIQYEALRSGLLSKEEVGL